MTRNLGVALLCLCTLVYPQNALLHASSGRYSPNGSLQVLSMQGQPAEYVKSNSMKPSERYSKENQSLAQATQRVLPGYPRIYGATFGFFIILCLAWSNEQEALEAFSTGTFSNVLDAAMPSSSTDLVAAALGEAIAGVIGSILSVALTKVVAKERKSILTETLINGDYFLAQAGLLPSLELAGLSPALASLGSTILATIPSQLIKLESRRQDERIKEEATMLAYLREERVKVSKQVSPAIEAMQESWQSLRTVRKRPIRASVDVSTLQEVGKNEIDFVEVFTDVARWLEYNILTGEYITNFVWEGEAIDPGVAGALLGILSAVSARLYADGLYGIFRCGPVSKQKEVQTRELVDWVAYYSSTALSAAILFGVYEFSQRPISRYIQGILAGGFDGCLGSDSFEGCLDIYIAANAPGPSPEAQVRALTSNLVMVGQRLQDIAGDTSFDDIQRLVRAWAVSFDSYLHALQ